MATITQASSFLSYQKGRRITRSTIQMPKKLNTDPLSLPKLPSQSHGVSSGVQDLRSKTSLNQETTDPVAVVEKLYLIMEVVADRVEMHKNIGEQRNNWNSLLLTSINAITLSAATMAAIAAHHGAYVDVLKLSSSFMYIAVTGMLIVMNKIQPSQLAEEQRNAARLLKQLHGQIQTKLAVSTPTLDYVNAAMAEVLAIDRAYPLPLLGVMLEKFPAKAQAAVWWPEKPSNPAKGKRGKNGWNEGLEDEMKEIIRVLEMKDKADYLRLDEKFLMLNKMLALSGPLLTGVGAIGSAFLGSSYHDPWAVVAGVACGVVATVVNSIEHGGQVGMVVEMYRSNAGFFGMVEESIESNLKEEDVEKRDDGELFEMKLALQLGRSIQELRDLAASTTTNEKDMKEFGSKLF
ncbi:probable F-box protein At4g22030 [Cynara cardunculus var. scolymus]|uniref:Petal formation-expressed n=1 Tax=Cynara cardunculus var. scolymus TaxID=59895 RepID=A0A103XTR0_CYNCS|nr:probable F-box protein At4g22030 [Cynara cardunculus var. scolymus]KVH96738.1 hypothetical protein Ccrd_001171 [Cynara cardunculus var. scolymus]